MRRLIITEAGSNEQSLYDVGVIDGLHLTYTQEKCLEDNMSYYDQVNGAVVVDWNAVLLAAEYKSPNTVNGITLDTIMAYEA